MADFTTNNQGDRADTLGTASPGRMVDALLDGDLSAQESREALQLIREDAVACEDLARTRIAIHQLREPIDTPDLSIAILDRVHARRRFLPLQSRRFITAGRVGIAAGLVGAIGIASLVQRHVPEVRLNAEPTPVAKLVEAAAPKPGLGTELADQTIETIKASLGSTATDSTLTRLTLSPRLRPDDAWHFDLDLSRESSAPWSTFIPHRHLPTQTLASNEFHMLPLGAPVLIEPFELKSAESSPLLHRFEPLMMYLREPPRLIESEAADPDENAS